jgi:hypothetical protein
MNKLYIVYEHASKLAGLSENFISNGQYYIINILKVGVELDTKVINFCFQSLFDTPPSPDSGQIGPFSELNDVSSFAYKICEETQSKSVSLIGLGQYNEALIHSKNKEEFREKLETLGESLTNLEDEAGMKTLFKRVFQINSKT